ncbi:MAG: DUF1998 domain-containing protein [candidate division Zixibacteria bacterium]
MREIARKKQSDITFIGKQAAYHRPVVSAASDMTSYYSDSLTLQRASTCPCDGGCPRCAPAIQPKLKIGQPNDKYEQEADRVSVLPQRAGPEEKDPIHGPLIREYRGSTRQPHGGVDEYGTQVGPSDAELKYSGILARFSSARWLSPIINRRNAAEDSFHSTPLIDPPGGLTTQFINGREIKNNDDVETAIHQPTIQSRTEKGRTYCWFNGGVNVTGRTNMDIYSPGPWDFRVTRAQAAAKYSWEKICRTGPGPVIIHVAGDPSDRAFEEYIRKREAEHDTDSEAAFKKNIASYVSDINRHVGDIPHRRVEAPDRKRCEAHLRRIENRDLLTQFVLDLNAATARRRAGGRHSGASTGLPFNKDCTRVTIKMGR